MQKNSTLPVRILIMHISSMTNLLFIFFYFRRNKFKNLMCFVA